jgi:hypothetical protein
VIHRNDLRGGLRALRERVGLELTALAEGLFRVHAERLWYPWGYGSFLRYCAAELSLEHSQAYRLVRTYQIYRDVWPEALTIGWHRLIAAAPLVVSGLRTSMQAIELCREDGANARALQKYVLAELVPVVGDDGDGAVSPAEEQIGGWDPHHVRDPGFRPMRRVRGVAIARRHNAPPRAGEAPGEWVTISARLERSVCDRFLAILESLPGALNDRVSAVCDAIEHESPIRWARRPASGRRSA